MNLTPLQATSAYSSIDAGNKLPLKQPVQNEEFQSSGQISTTAESAKTVDMRNISMNEINQLIRSGVDGGLLDRLPVKSILDSNGQFHSGAGGFLGDEKIDMIANIEQSISFKQSLGQSTTQEQEILNKYQQVNGQPYPKSINEFG